jgi:hypothetical protein
MKKRDRDGLAVRANRLERGTFRIPYTAHSARRASGYRIVRRIPRPSRSAARGPALPSRKPLVAENLSHGRNHVR